MQVANYFFVVIFRSIELFCEWWKCANGNSSNTHQCCWTSSHLWTLFPAHRPISNLAVSIARNNEGTLACETFPVAPERILNGGRHPSDAGKFFGRAPPRLWSKLTHSRFGERFRDGQHSFVTFLFFVLLLSVPRALSFVKVGARASRAPWSWRHWTFHRWCTHHIRQLVFCSKAVVHFGLSRLGYFRAPLKFLGWNRHWPSHGIKYNSGTRFLRAPCLPAQVWHSLIVHWQCRYTPTNQWLNQSHPPAAQCSRICLRVIRFQKVTLRFKCHAKKSIAEGEPPSQKWDCNLAESSSHNNCICVLPSVAK